MQQGRSLGIGLLGLGTVGSGVAKVLMERADSVAQEAGCPLVIRKILVLNPDEPQAYPVARDLLTADAAEVIDRPDVDIVIEVIGGERPALDHIQRALSLGKSVVTANKEVIAKHGPELFALARQHNAGLRFEASVGSGIPLITSLKDQLLANNIQAITAIINGTTNYILTRMGQEGIDFDAALREAQALGYAEPDPTNDVEGIDAAYKLAILATLGFHGPVRPEDVYREGIGRLNAHDFRYAHELGYAIKLLAIAKESRGAIQVRVHPTFISQDQILAKVDGVFNAVLVEGDLVGRVLFYGRGAGSLPTASAVVADAIHLALNISLGIGYCDLLHLEAGRPIEPMAVLETRYYLRLTVPDRAGVLAQIARVFADHRISIASVIQKETDETAQTAEIVIMTHLASEAAMQRTLSELQRLPEVREVGNFVRVESWQGFG